MAPLPAAQLVEVLGPARAEQRALLEFLRSRLVAHEDVEEVVVHAPAPPRLMYRTSCNQIATLGTEEAGVGVGLMLSRGVAEQVLRQGLAKAHPHPVYARAGWVHATVASREQAERLLPLLERAHQAARADEACLD